MDGMQNNSVLELVDTDSQDKALAIIRLGENTIGVSLSIEHGSDTEVFFRHADCVRFVEMLQNALTENSSHIVQQIEARVQSELPKLSHDLRTWVENHLTQPHLLTLASEADGADRVVLWLVTDHTGQNDSASRVVFDEIEGAFGLATTLNNDVEWFMGLHGGFANTLECM